MAASLWTCLDESHPKCLLEVMFELLKEQKYCDAALNVGRITIKLHKVVLLAMVPNVLLKFPHTEDDGLFQFFLSEDIDETSVKDFVRFLYTGSVALTPVNISGLAILAKRLNVPKLAQFCRGYKKFFKCNAESDIETDQLVTMETEPPSISETFLTANSDMPDSTTVCDVDPVSGLLHVVKQEPIDIHVAENQSDLESGNQSQKLVTIGVNTDQVVAPTKQHRLSVNTLEVEIPCSTSPERLPRPGNSTTDAILVTRSHSCHPKLEEAVKEWIVLSQFEKKVKIRPLEVLSKTQQLATELGLEFKGGRTWLKRFLKRHELDLEAGAPNTRFSYTASFKLEAIAVAESGGIPLASKIYGINENMIGEWLKQKDHLSSLSQRCKRKKRDRLGQHPNMEKKLKEWVVEEERRTGQYVINKKMREKAREICRELKIENFLTSKTWLVKFALRNDVVIGKEVGCRRGSRRSYTADFKLQVIKYTEETSIAEASEQFKVAGSVIRDWRKSKSYLHLLGQGRKRAPRGLNERYFGIDEKLTNWLGSNEVSSDSKTAMREICGRALLIAKLYRINDFCANKAWYNKFMKRNDVKLKFKT